MSDKGDMKTNTQKIKTKLVKKKGLTPRECEVFFVVGFGHSNLEASKSLEVSEGTVKFHLTNIFKKLNIKRRSQVVLLAHGAQSI